MEYVAEMKRMRERMLAILALLPANDIPHDNLGYASRYLRDAYEWLESEYEED
jgi:hypothetical protein